MYLRRQKYEQRRREKEHQKLKNSDEFKSDVRETRKVNASRSNSKFRDYDDELYEGHDAARERNRKMKELWHLEDEEKERVSRTMQKEEENRSQDRWQEELREINRFDTQYEFILEIVSKLQIFEGKIFNTRKNLWSQSLSVLVCTTITKIKDLLRFFPYDGYYFKRSSPKERENSAVFRAFSQKKEYLFKNMSKIATTLLHLHQQIAQIYVVKGREESESRSCRDFDRSCSKMSSYFEEEAEAFGILYASRSSKLSNLLIQLQDLDSVI